MQFGIPCRKPGNQWGDFPVESDFGPTLAKSRLRGHCRPLPVFQSEIVVHGLAEFLLAAEIPLGCLNRCVAKEKLDLLKFSACEIA
jgi:hypothetical protein